MVKVLFLISAILFIYPPTLLKTQDLPRKGTFGVQMTKQVNSSGILVQKVFDNSTASSLGIQKDDIILSINTIKYNNVNDLVKAIGEWKQGEVINVELKRNNQRINSIGKVVGKPLETSKYGRVIYDHVNFDGGKLRSITIKSKHV